MHFTKPNVKISELRREHQALSVRYVPVCSDRSRRTGKWRGRRFLIFKCPASPIHRHLAWMRSSDGETLTGHNNGR